MKTIQKAREVIRKLSAGMSIEIVQNELGGDKSEWYRVSAKAYALHLDEAQKIQEKSEKETHSSARTSKDELSEVLKINEQLSDLALCLPATSTRTDLRKAGVLLNDRGDNEAALICLIEEMTMHPRIRALQNIGRLQQFAVFKEFSYLIEAATLCFFRANYASSYLTLVPVVEGVILRWSGYTGNGEKPEFEEIRKFFSLAHTRHPCPGNPLFHQVFTKVCNKIINEHLYKPSNKGGAYSEFNRHQASHLLRDTEFATRANCIRLFLLIDVMAEVYLYETKCKDPRWKLSSDSIKREVEIYCQLLLDQCLPGNAERVLLKPS